MKNPLVSILIANYNNAKYLDDCIQSILNQTYSNWEIIFVDDDSTDNSLEIISKYSHLPITIVRNDKNKGCGYTKHRCASIANGTYLGFLDPDDALTTDAIETLVPHFDDNISMVYSRFYHCDEKLNVLSINPHQRAIPEGNSYLEIGNYAISHFVLFSKKAYNLSGGIDPLFRRAVDQDLYYKLEEFGSCFFVDKPLYYYRNNANGISQEKKKLAFLWHEIAKMHAYQRRGMNPELILNKITNREELLQNLLEKTWSYKLSHLKNRIKKLFGR